MKVYFGSINEKHQIECYTNSEKLAEIRGWTLFLEEEEIERGYDGVLYQKGFAPEKPQELLNKERIDELKQLLAEADYWGQKYIDGEYTDEEWEAKKAQRKAWRAEIRELEGENDEENGEDLDHGSV